MTSDAPGCACLQRSSGAVDLGCTLRRLAHSSASFGDPVDEQSPVPDVTPALNDTTAALVRLAAVIALGSSPAAYRETIEAAATAGATIDEVVGTLVAVAPTVGLARLISATPSLALALGYDIEAVFEGSDTLLDGLS